MRSLRSCQGIISIVINPRVYKVGPLSDSIIRRCFPAANGLNRQKSIKTYVNRDPYVSVPPTGLGEAASGGSAFARASMSRPLSSK